MLYIHKLSQLTTKSADLESVYLVRDIKQKVSYPLQEKQLSYFFQDFFISSTDKNLVDEALSLISGTVEKVELVLSQKNPLHEPFNLQRAIQILKELPLPLTNNLLYLEEISAWQRSSFVPETLQLLNAIPQLRTPQEKVAHNTLLNKPFQVLLRNTEFAFQSNDLVHEGQVQIIQGLYESMLKGFFFHYTLEEELKKLDFLGIKKRLPVEVVSAVEEIQKNIEIIEKGVKRAYEVNMRMVNKAVVLYAYVKWLHLGP